LCIVLVTGIKFKV